MHSDVTFTSYARSALLWRQKFPAKATADSFRVLAEELTTKAKSELDMEFTETLKEKSRIVEDLYRLELNLNAHQSMFEGIFDVSRTLQDHKSAKQMRHGHI